MAAPKFFVTLLMLSAAEAQIGPEAGAGKQLGNLMDFFGILFPSPAASPSPGATPCEIEAAGPRMPGLYVPKCAADGSYEPQQCYGSLGICFCVNSNGTMIPTTLRPHGLPAVNCSALTPCQQAAEAALPYVPGKFVPYCELDGSYRPWQCGAGGWCWCVDADGNKVPGTETGPGQIHSQCRPSPSPLPEPVPGAAAKMMPQENLMNFIRVRPSPAASPSPGATRCQIEASGTHMPGMYVPKCAADGSYEPKQCYGSLGICFCVNSNGTMIPTTLRPHFLLPVNCSALTPCQQAAEAALPYTPGKYVPHCEMDGDYRPWQCGGSSGECWCVDANGKEITGTRTAPGHLHSLCRPSASPSPMAGTAAKMVPQQEQEEGPFGEVVKQAVQGWALPSPVPSPTPGATSCQIAAAALKIIKSIYEPKCEADGSWAPQQCDHLGGFCWCVTPEGHVIPSTLRPSWMEQANCSALTPCQLAQAMDTTPYGPDAKAAPKFVPTCRPDGSYAPVQCEGLPFFGQCWCVDVNGVEIPNTRRRPGPRPLVCPAASPSPSA